MTPQEMGVVIVVCLIFGWIIGLSLIIARVTAQDEYERWPLY